MAKVMQCDRCGKNYRTWKQFILLSLCPECESKTDPKLLKMAEAHSMYEVIE